MGLLTVVEMDALPRFLPDDVGHGRSGLEERCHEVLARLGRNAHPDWTPHLERAGFAVTARSLNVASPPGRYAEAFLRRIRPVLVGQLAGDDLGILDRLLADQGPASLLPAQRSHGPSSRTVWAARRAAPSPLRSPVARSDA